MSSAAEPTGNTQAHTLDEWLRMCHDAGQGKPTGILLRRGWSAAPVRHGVSAIRSGQRYTLGLVFHDAA